MAFQPIVDIRAGRIYGHETLLRGVNGESASRVLAHITAENRYAFDQACRVRAVEQAVALGLDRKLSINFMPNAVYQPQACFCATLAAAKPVGFPLGLIAFEITEDERIRDSKHLQGIITEYKKHGFRGVLDDFGSEFAGLNSLSALHVVAESVERAEELAPQSCGCPLRPRLLPGAPHRAASLLSI